MNGTDIKIGVMVPIVDGLVTSGHFLREFGAACEELRIESVWTVEHVIVAESYERLYPYSEDGRMPPAKMMPDPLETLAFLGAVTRTVKLGTSVVVAPLHSPVVLAKRAATIDRLTDGRLLLGLGIGWQKEEYSAIGVPYRERGARMEEYVYAMRELWHHFPATYKGRFVSFDRVFCEPRPTGPSVPILFGGNTDAAVTRAARIGNGWFPYTITPDDYERQADLLRRTAEVAERDVDDIELSAWPGSYRPSAEDEVDTVRRYVNAGAQRLIVRAGITEPNVDGFVHRIVRFREDVLSRL